MSDHSGFRATASALLQKHGRSAVLSQKMASPGPTPWEPGANVVVPLTAIMLFFPTTLRDDKGSVIPGDFQKCFVASADLETAFAAWIEVNAPSLEGTPMPKITTKDTITDNGKEFRIVRVNDVKPGDQSILYEITIAG